MNNLESIDHTTKIVGIVGHPIKQSFSPKMHNLTFQQQGLNYIYLPFDVVTSTLGDSLKAMNVLGIRGLNVTIPHKEKHRPVRCSPVRNVSRSTTSAAIDAGRNTSAPTTP